MKAIIIILVIVITLVSMIPFLDIAAKIEWITYLGILLIMFTGSAGIAFVTRRFEAIIGGVILSALWPIMHEIARSALSCL